METDKKVPIPCGSVVPEVEAANIAAGEKVRADAIRKMARKLDVDVDDDAVVSEGDDNGAYVAAWVWVDFSGTAFDKEDDEEGCRTCGETGIHSCVAPCADEDDTDDGPSDNRDAAATDAEVLDGSHS